MRICEATTKDTNDVLNIVRQAFDSEIEPQLVSDLLSDPSAAPTLSLLASVSDEGVGHILFTKISLSGPQKPVKAAILAPLAIKPGFQKQGIGGALIKEGLRLLKENSIDLVFVLGHIDYYPRFGFQTAGRLGFEAPFLIPQEVEDAWMVQPLKDGLIGTLTGQVKCADTLNRPEYWRE